VPLGPACGRRAAAVLLKALRAAASALAESYLLRAQAARGLPRCQGGERSVAVCDLLPLRRAAGTLLRMCSIRQLAASVSEF
jgi:hypothetical protein